MTKHLPECRYYPSQSIVGDVGCICSALRACEQRTLKKVIQKAELTFRSDIINPVRDIVEPLSTGYEASNDR